jgi:Ca-activated chloride channel family protein
MCATDVDPNRLTVAQDAALAFIEDQADDTRIGIVAFASFAELVVPPTNDKEALREGIRNFTTSIGTAVGSATLKSLDAIASVNGAVAPSGVDLSSQRGDPPVQDGFYQPDIIVVLTDGANTRGPLPLDAAQKASDRQVRVYTIGFGSRDPGEMVCTPEQMGPVAFSRGGLGGGGFGGFGGADSGFGGFGGGFRGGFRRFLLLDEATLEGMANATGGEYYRAEDADQLYDVFVTLPTEVVLQKERVEISVIFSIFGAVFVAVAMVLSLIWHRFP